MSNINIDNFVCIRGKLITTDFTNNYQTYDSGKTCLSIPVAVPKPIWNRQENSYPNDLIVIKMWGHVKTEEIREGMAERFLKRASKGTVFTFYCHLNHSQWISFEGVKRSRLDVICDKYRCDNLKSRQEEILMDNDKSESGMALAIDDDDFILTKEEVNQIRNDAQQAKLEKYAKDGEEHGKQKDD